MFADINVRWLLLIISILTLVFSLTTIIITVKFKHKFSKIPAIMTIIGISCIIGIVIAYCIAIPHGLHTQNVTIRQLSNGIANTPIEDKLPADLSGAIIIFYKFGCTDCEAIYHDLSNYVTDKQDIYWISSQSKQGQALIAQYPIDYVPTGIYISEDTDDAGFVKKALTESASDGSIRLNTEAIDRLLYLQEQNR